MAYWRVSVAYSPHQYNTSTPSQQTQHDAAVSWTVSTSTPSQERRRVDGVDETTRGHLDAVEPISRAVPPHAVDAMKRTLVKDHFANSCDQFERVDKGATTKNGPGTPRSKR